MNADAVACMQSSIDKVIDDLSLKFLANHDVDELKHTTEDGQLSFIWCDVPVDGAIPDYILNDKAQLLRFVDRIHELLSPIHSEWNKWAIHCFNLTDGHSYLVLLHEDACIEDLNNFLRDAPVSTEDEDGEEERMSRAVGWIDLIESLEDGPKFPILYAYVDSLGLSSLPARMWRHHALYYDDERAESIPLIASRPLSSMGCDGDDASLGEISLQLGLSSGDELDTELTTQTSGDASPNHDGETIPEVKQEVIEEPPSIPTSTSHVPRVITTWTSRASSNTHPRAFKWEFEADANSGTYRSFSDAVSNDIEDCFTSSPLPHDSTRGVFHVLATSSHKEFTVDFYNRSVMFEGRVARIRRLPTRLAWHAM